MEKVNWKVEGMSCTNCALTINKYLQEKGLQNVKVNFIGGEVSFDTVEGINKAELAKGIGSLGYQVLNPGTPVAAKKMGFKNHFQRFMFCLLFTAPLLLHMVGVTVRIFLNPYVQLGLTIPVYLVGMGFFGRSALKSLSRGIPNMNVLITLGSTAAFGYSLYGTLTGQPDRFMFYESAAAIITFIFFGNWMEDKAVQSTQAALNKLAVSQKVMAHMITYDEQHNEHLFPVENTSLHVGDLILIKSGETVPMDCKILWGEVRVNEAIITGESLPVEKKMSDSLIGGSVLENGTAKAYVTAVGENTVLSNIVKMTRDAQTEKPPVQQLADKISVIFVPVVVSIALLTFLGNFYIGGQHFGESLLRSISVLVIACPCAMGLATPAAIAVGLGRAAKNGILFRNARTLEVFRNIRQVVFDKTGTLTTGEFKISGFHALIDEVEFKRIAFSLEKFSSHPIAKCIAREWKSGEPLRWEKVAEIKGLGMEATDKTGIGYRAGSYKTVSHLTKDDSHGVYLTKNNSLIGWIDVQDAIREEAGRVVRELHAAGIRTVLLSGDSQAKCESVAKVLGIDEVIAGQTPEQKLSRVAAYNTLLPTAMVGDGINDAPALAKAAVGISLSDASQLAIQTAQVVLMNHGLKNLPLTLGLGKQTYQTIRQNLFWAFFYNIVAIPVAAAGMLSPAIAALAMGFSDVILAANSIRLNWKKIK